ncbi:hypothetical protein N7532_009552 [Penicillium argentinense]|uniref:Zn(2)-C6 fungal-type domain-containing protein n=1 Tax=Penicillium argentinense TaxID=1131581 RepID=A0A9W9K2N9_9EURO|nr:uncharacterized protein N7532_009552 [Penicillium argentinense]KAJ5090868.1 hypothetical protein N7532_009552 [Penicillium argentinense]
MSDSQAQYNPRKRRRPALSCEQCRRRKVRCDREMPCGPCKKAYGSMDCSYVYEGKAALESRRNGFRASGYESPPSVGAQAGPHDGAHRSPDGARMAQMESTIRALQDRVQSLEQSAQSGSSQSQRVGDMTRFDGVDDRIGQRFDDRRDEIEQPQTLIAPLAPRLKGTGEKTKLFGTTHWAIVFQQFRLLRQVRSTAMSVEGKENDIGKLHKEIRSMRRLIKGRQAPRLVDPTPGLLNDLPSREVCDDLVHHYLRTLELVYRVLHVPVFYEEYDRFWENRSSVTNGFMFKLLLILAIGSVFYCRPGPANELGIPVRRWVYAAQWWLTGPFDKETDNLEGLQVNCLLLLCRQAYAIDKEASWASAGTLVRLAIRQGLHRDPKNFPTLSPYDCEMRRRIWATIIEINVQFAIDAAMPPLLGPYDFDTLPPSNLDDEEFNQATTSLPSPQPRDFYTSSSLQILLLESFPVRLRIARAINECGQRQSYEMALKLGSDLTASCKDMTRLMHGFISRATARNLRPTLFHHRLMDTLLRRFLINIYRPFVVQAIHDPRFYLSRKLSLESALLTASYADAPSDSSADHIPHRDFQRLSLSGAGVFKGYLSLDVLVVISLEVITQLEDEVARQPTDSDQAPPDAVIQMAQAARAPLIQALEKLWDHLYQGLVVGIPSMKRYCLLGGILAQIRAVPRGEQAEWNHIRDAFMDTMETCRTLLQQHIADERLDSIGDAALTTPADGANQWTPEGVIGSSLDSDFMIPNLGLEDLSFWDIPGFADADAFDPPQLPEVP